MAVAGIARAHEFWIAPHDYTIAPGDEVVADLKVGQEFQGVRQAYLPQHFDRFELIRNGAKVEVASRIGDRPALHQVIDEDGLWVILHETSDFLLVYDDYETFRGFVTHKDLKGVLERHAERGLPKIGIRELYRRFAKSLIAVGSGRGRDGQTGMRFEFVAETNPYAADFNGALRLLLLWQGQPVTNAQVELFDRAPDGKVTITLHRTGTDGRVTLPVRPGHEYLADSVKMLELSGRDPETGPVWGSAWASMTFTMP